MRSTIEKMIERLERRFTWMNAGLAVGIIVLANVALGGYILPNIEARRPEALEDGFLVMIDLHPLLSAEAVYRIFDLYQPDILGFVRLLYAVDFVFPAAFAFLVAFLIGKLLRYRSATPGGWRSLVLLPFVTVLFDYTENALTLFLTGQYQDGQVFPMLARVASVATACKMLALILSGLTMVTLLLRTAARLIASKLGRPRGGD